MNNRAQGCCLLFALVITLFAGNASAQNQQWEARAFWQRLDPMLEAVTPPTVRDIIPGYLANSKLLPGVVVADLENAAGTEGDWGKTVGQILRWDLAYAYSPALPGVDFRTYYQDAFTPGLSRSAIGRQESSAELVAKRLGLNHSLTGRIGVRAGTFTLELQLRNLTARTVVDTMRFSGELATLPATLDGIAVRIHTVLKLVKPEARNRRAALANVEQMQKLVAALSLAGDAPREKQNDAIRSLWSTGAHTPLAAALYLNTVEAPTPREYLQQLDAVRAEFPGDPGVELAVARLMPTHDGLFDTKKQRLSALIRGRPHDPMPMLVLADALADNGYAVGAVTVMREAMRRWPDNYRAWWSGGYALLTYGWELRGNNYWKDVPETSKRLFPALKEAAGRAADKALAQQQDSSPLWVFKMMTIGQYSQEFMNAYRHAIELDPLNRHAYDMALNYTLPQWGGSRAIQDQVWKDAGKNIHDPAWIEHMQQRYRSKS